MQPHTPLGLSTHQLDKVISARAVALAQLQNPWSECAPLPAPASPNFSPTAELGPVTVQAGVDLSKIMYSWLFKRV